MLLAFKGNRHVGTEKHPLSFLLSLETCNKEEPCCEFPPNLPLYSALKEGHLSFFTKLQIYD
jgi:hypothetical protein